MKANKNLMVAALILLLLTSCKKDGQMLTVINEDGTCVRELTKHVSPRDLIDSDIYPDNGKEAKMEDWEQTWSLMGEDTRYPMPMTQEQYDSIQRNYHGEYVPEMVLKHYKRVFPSVEDMSNNLPINNSMLKVEGSLKKHFKWFYTDIEFNETYAYNTSDSTFYFPIPLDRFISADSASYWFTGQPDLSQKRSGAELKELLDEIEGKVSKWINANLFAEMYDYVYIENYDKIKNSPVSKERFIALRDTLAMSPAILNQQPYNNGKTIMKVINDYFKSDAITSAICLYDSIDTHYTKHGQIMELFLDYDLVMPGKVRDAGMGLYDGEVIHYKLTGDRLIPGSYTISATSRVTNVWAFVVTFFVIAIAVGSFFYRKKNK